MTAFDMSFFGPETLGLLFMGALLAVVIRTAWFRAVLSERVQALIPPGRARVEAWGLGVASLGLPAVVMQELPGVLALVLVAVGAAMAIFARSFRMQTAIGLGVFTVICILSIVGVQGGDGQAEDATTVSTKSSADLGAQAGETKASQAPQAAEPRP